MILSRKFIANDGQARRNDTNGPRRPFVSNLAAAFLEATCIIGPTPILTVHVPSSRLSIPKTAKNALNNHKRVPYDKPQPIKLFAEPCTCGQQLKRPTKAKRTAS